MNCPWSPGLPWPDWLTWAHPIPSGGEGFRNYIAKKSLLKPIKIHIYISGPPTEIPVIWMQWALDQYVKCWYWREELGGAVPGPLFHTPHQLSQPPFSAVFMGLL
jgi:hypothetical protein